MTKRRVFTPDDGHQHFWERQFHLDGGFKVWEDRWICRRCKTVSTSNPFQEEAQ